MNVTILWEKIAKKEQYMTIELKIISIGILISFSKQIKQQIPKIKSQNKSYQKARNKRNPFFD